MIYHKLQDYIESLLKNRDFGNNKITVRTTSLGEVFIYDFAQDPELEKLQDEIESLREELEELQEEVDDLNNKLDISKHNFTRK